MPFRPAINIAMMALVAMLTACHPVDTWRSITGVNKDDPDPATTPNSQNLAAGEKQPYPNLATVPSPPIPTMTQAERDKLTESLVADRTNAKYNQEQLLPGSAPAGEPPPPPPSAGPSPAANVGATPPKGPIAAAPGAAPANPATAKATPQRKPGEPPQPGPMESNLQSPTIKEQPVAETTQPPPPPPQPAVAPAPAPSGPGVPATAMASAAPQPPPPPPSIAPVAAPPPAPAPATPTPVSAEARPGVGRTMATIDFPSPTANFTQADRGAIDRIAAQFQQKPGTIHIIAYAAAASAGRSQLDAYRDALDRGQAVAKALAGDGVPVGKIQTEASPSREGSPSGRVVIQLAP
jgi:outer membrane protein OmpA-like peptidoglycan-associated protein